MWKHQNLFRQEKVHKVQGYHNFKVIKCKQSFLWLICCTLLRQQSFMSRTFYCFYGTAKKKFKKIARNYVAFIFFAIAQCCNKFRKVHFRLVFVPFIVIFLIFTKNQIILQNHPYKIEKFRFLKFLFITLLDTFYWTVIITAVPKKDCIWFLNYDFHGKKN